MAVRRNSDDLFGSGGGDDRFLGDPLLHKGDPGHNVFGFGDGAPQPGSIIEDLPPDASYLIGGGDQTSTSGGEGNTERGRNIFPGDTPSMLQPQPGGSPPPLQLPQGVSVNDALAQDNSDAPPGGSFSGATMDTPVMPTFPSPIAQQTPNPGYAQLGTQAPTVGSGPQRRSVVSPQIFGGETRNPSLYGRAGGLLGGGLGATGAGEPSGPIMPTEMMRKLVQLFRQQG